MGGGITKGGIFGLPADPITRKLNEALGIVPKEEKPLTPLPPVVSPVVRPEGKVEDERTKRGRRPTVLTSGSTVPEGKSLLTEETTQ